MVCCSGADSIRDILFLFTQVGHAKMGEYRGTKKKKKKRQEEQYKEKQKSEIRNQKSITKPERKPPTHCSASPNALSRTRLQLAVSGSPISSANRTVTAHERQVLIFGNQNRSNGLPSWKLPCSVSPGR